MALVLKSRWYISRDEEATRPPVGDVLQQTFSWMPRQAIRAFWQEEPVDPRMSAAETEVMTMATKERRVEYCILCVGSGK